MSKTESRNREALDTRTWLDEHGDALYRFALLRVRNSTVAEDLVQDTLLAGLQGKTRFAGGSSVRTWLIGILKNKIIDHMRRTGREGVLPEEPIDDVCDAMFREDHSYHWRVMPSVWDDPDGALEQQEFWEAFYRCLGDLPERQSQAFTLTQVDGLDGGEACKVLGVSSSNLWVLLYRARLRLRECLEQQWFAAEGL